MTRSRLRLFPFAFILGLGPSLMLADTEEFVLVEAGRPVATIVIAAQPTAQAQSGATALQRYIEKISGAKLTIATPGDPTHGTRILVGRSAALDALGVTVPAGFTPQINEEAFIIKTVGRDLVLAGNEEGPYRGTIYAVYDLLQQFGCRWFFPGPYGEVVPTKRRLTIDTIDRLERPSFRFRNLWYSGWFPSDTQDSAWLTTWYDQNKLAMIPMSLPGDGSVTRLAPADQYFKSHPHIYALDKKGERIHDMLCVSEPDAVKISVDTITEEFEKNPETLSFGFAPPDGFPVCHCERCQRRIPGFSAKGYGDPSLSDAWFHFANEVAKRVYEQFPDRWLFTNGYANRVRPPEGIVEFSPNLGIQSAIIAACVLHRIGDPKCWQRTLYKQVLNRWTDDLRCVFVYDYDPGTSLANLPFPALHNLRYDLPYFKERGVWGFWTEGTNTWMVTHLNYYVRAKLMWDVEADVDAIVRDYCDKFYGAAADLVEEYIWTLEAAVENTEVHGTWGRLMAWRVILAPVIGRLDDLIATAEAKGKNQAEVERRVALLRVVHNHMRAYLEMEEAVARGEFADGVQWGQRMVTLRDAAAEFGPGLLPHTPDWVKTFRTSLEWHISMYRDLAERAGGERGELITILPRRWQFKFDPKDVGVLYQWYNADQGGEWDNIDTTLYWEAQGHQDDDGFSRWGKAWYRTGFHVPASATDKPVWLTIGAIYNRGLWVWVNGVMQSFKMKRHRRLGHHDVRTPIDINVTPYLRPGQINHVAVLVHTPTPGRNPRGGIHRRSFLWTPRTKQ